MFFVDHPERDLWYLLFLISSCLLILRLKFWLALCRYWQNLEPAASVIERIDVHGNPNLMALPARCADPSLVATPRPAQCTAPAGPTPTPPSSGATSPACSFATFARLRELTVDDTNLALLGVNDLQPLRDTLDTLNMVGFLPLFSHNPHTKDLFTHRLPMAHSYQDHECVVLPR